MKKVIITGSSGFIGKHTLPFLTERGYEVYPLRLDLIDQRSSLEQIKKIKPDSLLHLAWETTPNFFWHAPSNLDWLKSSLDLIENFAICGGKRVVIAGSCAEYTTSKTIYGACKESLRITSTAFLKKQEVSFAWGHIFSPYGPYEKEQRLIPTLIKSHFLNTPFTCLSQNHVRDFMFIEDVAEAFVTLLESSVEGRVDIGSGEGIRLGELVKKIASKMGNSTSLKLSSAPASPDNPAELVANTQRLIHEVGFTPKHSFETGIDKTIQWWESQIHNSCLECAY